MILLVDDDSSILHSLELMLKQEGFASRGASSVAQAREHFEDPAIDLVVQDMNFSRQTSGAEGLALLAEIRARRPELPVILITAWGSIELAVEGMRAGAADFITKPWSREQVLHAVRTALGLVASGSRTRDPGPAPSRDDLDARFDFSEIVGHDPRLLAVLDVIGRVASTDASVLITGESGSGKELVADALHRNSRRFARPFVKVNLGGTPTSLFESEMFGHVRGAFTDAHRDRVGRFEAADGGTIFLDEIGDLEPAAQVKLLRVLQERRFEPLGSSRTRSVDVRVVSATNRDLAAAVRAGRFREDLLYRLNLITVHLPSLAERRGDVPILVQYFLARLREQYQRPTLTVRPEALRWLAQRSWPGNVRQLRQVLERTVLVANVAALSVADFERALALDPDTSTEATLPRVGAMTLEEMECAMIRKALDHHASNITRAAESLGMSRAALYRRLEKYGIES